MTRLLLNFGELKLCRALPSWRRHRAPGATTLIVGPVGDKERLAEIDQLRERQLEFVTGSQMTRDRELLANLRCQFSLLSNQCGRQHNASYCGTADPLQHSTVHIIVPGQIGLAHRSSTRPIVSP